MINKDTLIQTYSTKVLFSSILQEEWHIRWPYENPVTQNCQVSELTLKWRCWELHRVGHFKLAFTTLKKLCGQVLILSTSYIGLPCTDLLLTSLFPCTKLLFTSREVGGSVELDKNLAYNEWFEWMNLELARKYKHMPHLLGTFTPQENSGST